MARKSAHMLRPNKHKVVLLGKTYPITAIVEDGDVLVIQLGDGGGVLRRTKGAKIEVGT